MALVDKIKDYEQGKRKIVSSPAQKEEPSLPTKKGLITIKAKSTAPKVKLNPNFSKEIGPALGESAKRIGGVASRLGEQLNAGTRDLGGGVANAARTADSFITRVIDPSYNVKQSVVQNSQVPASSLEERKKALKEIFSSKKYTGPKVIFNKASVSKNNRGAMFGDSLEGYINTQEREANESQQRAEAGASDVEKIIGGAVRAIPQMTSGTPAFVASTFGNYARQAENEGANLNQRVAFAIPATIAEVTLEKLLGVVPGYKGLKKAATGGIKGITKRTAGEMIEEAVTTPVIDGIKALTYNPEVFKDVSFGQYLTQMGFDGLGGGVLSLMMAGLGMPLKSKSHQQSQALIDSGKEVSVQQAENLYNTQIAEKTENQFPTAKAEATATTFPISKQSYDAMRAKNTTATTEGTKTGANPTGQAEDSVGQINSEDSVGAQPNSPQITAEEYYESMQKKYGKGTLNKMASNERTQLIDAEVSEFVRDGFSEHQALTLRLYAYERALEKFKKSGVFGGKRTIRRMEDGIAYLKNRLTGNHPGNVITEISGNQAAQAQTQAATTIKSQTAQPQQKAVSPTSAPQTDAFAQKMFVKYGIDYEQKMNGQETAEMARIFRTEMGTQQGQPQFTQPAENQPNPIPVISQEGADLFQKHKEAQRLKTEYERAKANANLSAEELNIADQIRRGKLSQQNIPQGFRTAGIMKVASAGAAYDNAKAETQRFNIERKENLDEEMQNLVSDSDDWKDKSIGFLYSRETQERNIKDIAGKSGQKIIDQIFTPIHENEARGTKLLNDYRGRVRNMNLTKQEAEYVQRVGEKNSTLNDLPPNMDKNKINTAVNQFRNMYNELISLANDVLVKNGYAPVDYRKDYFPHFENPDDILGKALKKLGIRFDTTTLPTDIAGITYQFKPGKKWFGNFLKRTGKETSFDAVEGFDRYVQGIKDVIFHTYDIQRLRAFERSLRMKYAPDNVKERITEIKKTYPIEEQQTAIDDILSLERGHLGNYVTDLRVYTDSLAGKKSISDRGWENNLGRGIYNVMDALQNQVSRNMISINPGSWLTNLIPLTQGGAAVKSKNFMKAAYDTVKNLRNDDGFSKRSSFITNRQGSDPLVKNWIQKATDITMSPMKFLDDITSSILVRAKYYDLVDKGADPKNAMKQADQFASNVIADRSKGALPTVFNSKNPINRLFTTFQVEVNNQLSYLFKDMPADAKQNGVKWTAATLMKFAIGSWIFNKLFEWIVGRKPAIDPIGTVEDVVKNVGDGKAVLSSLGENIGGNIPFVGGVLFNGGRLPISAALPDFTSLFEGNTTVWKELQKPLTYILPPMGGGQIKKSIEGIGAFARGYSQTDNGKMRFPIKKDLLNAARTFVFGQYSTPEARQYFDQGRLPLSKQQTDKINRMVDAGIDVQTAYSLFITLRNFGTKAQKQAYLRTTDKLTEKQKLQFAEIYFE